MAHIRELYEMRFATINPVVDLIDKCVGVQSIDADLFETSFHLVTYGELFGSAIGLFLETGMVPEVASVEMQF